MRGLINILNDYKFTVAENTPLEEEIALDPELLGRIFENLLASYNPETKTSARKQTGSFYTPREIVNYMVDESLMAYLKNEILQSHAGALKLGEQQVALFGEQTNKKGQFSLETQPNASRWNGRENELEQNLRILFDTSETQPFTDTQDVQDLIRAIDTCKILDPACGSGAFPMGILHRMVNLLHKLDPKNHLWEERQLFNAESIEDPNARDEAIKAIKKAFEKNELDYGRKLYLIENCIYGVDIQPIAVQIAKLRFFISLICDQKMEDTEGVENRGVLALPNLETKFVAANTLIGLDNSNLAKMAVEDLMKQREQLRHRIFSAKRYADKKRYREQDERIRQQIKDKLDTLGMGGQTEQLADWNPFDQNASAPFFDADWMFNIKNGFDVVIGNPPYVQLQKLKEDASQLQKMRYKTFERTGDIYCLFYEKGIHLLKYKGVLSFITSSQWVKAAYGKSLRSYFLEFNPLFLLELGAGVFESATVDTNILFIEKAPNKKILKGIVVQKIEDVALSDYAAKMLAMPYVNKENWVVSDFAKQYITETIRKKGKPLKDWRVKIYFGVKTGFNDAFLIKEDTCNRLLEEDEKNIDLIRPILRGREIEKYYTSWEGDYVIATFPTFNLDIKAYPSIKQYLEGFLPKIYQTGEEFYNSEGVLEKTRKKTGNKWFETQDQIAFYEEFSKEKIIWKRIGSQLRFSYSDKEIYSLDSTCIATGEKIKYLTALLNSKVSHYQLFENSPKTGMGDLIISVQALEPLHVYYPKDEEQIIIEQILDFIIYQKRTPSVSAAIGQYLEQVIDGMVCELYFTEEMTSKGIDIIGIVSQDLAALPDFAPLSTEAKQAQIETLYRKWTAPASELNNRLSLMTIRSPDVLGVILGGK